MNSLMTGGLILLMTGLVATLAGERTGWRMSLLVGKPSASVGFLLLALGAGALDSPYGRWILAGLALSLVGDVFLMFFDRVWFLSGLVSFLLAHLAYVGAFVVAGISVTWSVVGAVGAFFSAWLVLRWLFPHVDDDMRGPVLAYVVVISVMASLALGTLGAGHSALIVAGAALFYLSDLFVARDRFVVETFANRLIGLPLYYGGQALLALSVATLAG